MGIAYHFSSPNPCLLYRVCLNKVQSFCIDSYLQITLPEQMSKAALKNKKKREAKKAKAEAEEEQPAAAAYSPPPAAATAQSATSNAGSGLTGDPEKDKRIRNIRKVRVVRMSIE